MSKPLDELIESFLESAEELKGRITDIEKAIDRQGIDRMPAGAVVDKTYCTTEHKSLIKSVSFRLYAAWVVFLLIIGGYGMVLRVHDKYIHDLMQLVF